MFSSFEFLEFFSNDRLYTEKLALEIGLIIFICYLETGNS